MLANAHAVNINNTDANNTKIILDLLFIIRVLCRLLYLVVVRFQKAQYLVVFSINSMHYFGFCAQLLAFYWLDTSDTNT